MEQPEFYINEHDHKIWYLPSKGKNYLHRLDGPAIEEAHGTKQWWVNDQCHRLDGPAIEEAHGTKYWLVNGQRHRLDGPAIEHADGTKSWYVNDQCHRLDGPAIELANGTKAWYVNGQKLDTEKVEAWLEENNADLKTKEGQMAFKLRWL